MHLAAVTGACDRRGVPMSAITSTSDGGLVRYAFSCPSLSDAFEVTGFTGVERLNAMSLVATAVSRTAEAGPGLASLS